LVICRAPRKRKEDRSSAKGRRRGRKREEEEERREGERNHLPITIAGEADRTNATKAQSWSERHREQVSTGKNELTHVEGKRVDVVVGKGWTSLGKKI